MVNYDTQNGYSVKTYQIPQHLFNSFYTKNHKNDDINPSVKKSSWFQSNRTILEQPTELITAPISVLTIDEVHFRHAGNYTCAPSNVRPATINVHVLRGNYTYVKNRGKFVETITIHYTVIICISSLRRRETGSYATCKPQYSGRSQTQKLFKCQL